MSTPQPVPMMVDMNALQNQLKVKLKSRQERQATMSSDQALESQPQETTPGDTGSETCVQEHQDRGTTRYRNPAWQSSSIKRRPTLPPHVAQEQESNSAGGGQLQQRQLFKQQLEQQLKGAVHHKPPPPPAPRQIQNDHQIEFPPPPPEAYDYDMADSVPDLMAQSPQQDVQLQRQFSSQSEERPMKYRRLHLYVHGVHIGTSLNLSDNERFYELEKKFAAIGEIFSSVDIFIQF